MADAKSDKGGKSGAAEKGGKPGKTDKAAPKGAKPDAGAEAKAGKGKGRPAQTEVATAGRPKSAPKDYVARLRKIYQDEIVPKLVKEFGYKNALQVPKIEKVVLNMGVGEAVNDTKKVTSAASDLALIAGQKAIVTRARKAISTFKVREHMPIGAKVTLRKTRMYEFLDRLVSIAIPRIRDFRGISSRSFDGRGNYSLGVKEQIIFPEIQYDQIDQIRGMDITISTSAADDKHGRALLEAFKFPFRK